MYLIDSHCHLDRLDLDRLGGDLDQVLTQARAEGVGRILCVSIDLESLPGMLAVIRGREAVVASVGVHPNEKDCNEPTVDTLLAYSDSDQVVALGETGLDYHYGQGDLEWQRRRFRTHIRAARESGLPLIIHSRDAREDTIALLREEGGGAVRGVMHCFTEDQAMAEAAMDLGFLISFSGIVTFRNAGPLREVAAGIPDDRLLIETDAPYLTPVPYRGRPNQPAYVRHVAECLAELRGVSVEHITRVTYDNFGRLFGVN